MDTPDLEQEELFEFRCAKCGIALTDPLRELTDEEMLCDEDAEPAIPQGYFFVEDGHVIINVRDRLNVRRVKDEDRCQGCCGMDGLDGPNTECINGHEVGTEISDCWLPHSLTFQPNAVARHAAPAEVPSTAPVRRLKRDSKPIPWRPSRA